MTISEELAASWTNAQPDKKAAAMQKAATSLPAIRNPDLTCSFTGRLLSLTSWHSTINIPVLSTLQKGNQIPKYYNVLESHPNVAERATLGWGTWLSYPFRPKLTVVVTSHCAHPSRAKPPP
jgi:hypothetical protein